MPLVIPDALAAVLSGAVDQQQPQAPAPPPPIIDSRYGRKPMTSAALATPQAMPKPQASPVAADPNAPAYSQPATDTSGTSAPNPATPNIDALTAVNGAGPAPAVRSNRSALIPPSMDNPIRDNAMKTLSTPAPTYEQNKPSFLRRLGGGLSAAAMAYGHVPGAVEAGQNVTNAPFDRAMDAYQTNQKQAKEVLGEQDNQFKNLSQLYNNSMTQDYREENLSEKERHNQSEEDLRGKLTDVKDRLATTQQQNVDQRNPMAKFKASMDQRRAEIAELGKDPKTALNPDEQKYYLANGKLKEQDPYAQSKIDMMRERLNLQSEKNDIDREKAERQRPGGKSSATFKDKAAVDKYSNSWYTKNQNDYNKQRNDLLKNKDLKDDERQAQIKTLDDLNGQQKAEFEQRKQGYYSALSGGQPVSIDENGEVQQPTTGVRTPAQLGTKNLKTVGQKAAAPPPGNPKTVSRDVVQQYATAKGIPYATAEQGFIGKGYAVK